MEFEEFMAKYIEFGFPRERLPLAFDQIRDDMLYTPTMVAELLGLKEPTTRRWFRDGKIRGLGGSRYRTTGHELKRFIFHQESKRLKKEFPALFKQP